jgi:CHAT domain-containing protein
MKLNQLTGDSKYKEGAFLFSERSKSAVLLESLLESNAKSLAGIPDSLIQHEQQLRKDLTGYNQRVLEEQLKGEMADKANIALWQAKILDFRQTYDGLVRQFEIEFPDYYNLKYNVNTATVPDVQGQILDEQTALVEYSAGIDSIFIFTITKDDFAVMGVTKDSLFEHRIGQIRNGVIAQNYGQYIKSAYELYQILLQPALDRLSVQSLIIVPDVAMSAIPFEVLLTRDMRDSEAIKDYADLPYLIDSHVISYAYSATVLQEMNRKDRELARRDYVAFAPIFADGLPAGTRAADLFHATRAIDSLQAVVRFTGYLPGSEKEVTGILDLFKERYSFFERLFDQNANAYLNDEANEAKVKSPELADYRYVHFATHGLINEINPELSGLLLAQCKSTKEDGILFLVEVYNLNLNADLVVLSGCETGLGQIASGEGIIGLARAFLYAGASNLLVSLWQVDDPTTAVLMVDFYQKVLLGMTMAEALRGAKLRMIRGNPKFARPYYWAPFILAGH